ncbi:hypothetical protein ACFVH0_07265 [Streptomyces sp. NPDC127117]
MRSFPAAHHEVGQAGFGERVRKLLAQLALLDGWGLRAVTGDSGP